MPLYEYEEGTSRKFYRIDLDGRRVRLNWGRIGTEGQHQILTFETAAEAKLEYERQCDKRTQDRNYSRIHDEAAPRDPEQVSRERLEKIAPLSDSPRFLFTKKRKFAWVEARGNILMSVKGLRADEDKVVPVSKQLASPEAAVKARDAMVAKLLAGGYELETFGKSEKPKRGVKEASKLVDCSELEQLLDRDPYDDASWSVLEDFLLQHEDDPRAELIRLSKANLRGEEAQARGKCLPLLLGKKHESLNDALIAPGWRAGYLLDARLRLGTRGLKSALAAFVASPTARLIRELELHIGPQKSMDEICAVLAQAPCARTLRRLKFLHEHEQGQKLALVALDCGMLSGLKIVELDGGQLPLFVPSALPTLETLRSRAMSSHQLDYLLKGSLPALRRLVLDLRPADDWLEPSPKWQREVTTALERVANGEFAPQLKALEISVNEPAVEEVRELLKAGAVTRSCELVIV